MPPYYYDPSAGFSSGLTPLIMQVTMVGIVAGTFFQPAPSIATTVVTLLVVGLVFDLGQKAIDFLTSVLVARLKVNQTYEEGTVEYQWIRAFLTQKKKWPDAYGKPYTIEDHTTKLWWNGTWMSAIQCDRKDTYYSYTQQNEIPKPYIDLTLYSLKSSAISNLLKEAKRQYEEIRHHDVTVYSHTFVQNLPSYSNNTQNWSDKKDLPARMMDSTSLSIQALTSLVEEARNFFDSETWYNEAGIPWQKRYLLHGPSGSGKRDAVYAVAGKLGRAVYTLSLADCVDKTFFLSAMKTIPKGSIFLLENIDRAFENLAQAQSFAYSPYSSGQPSIKYSLFDMLDTTARQEGILLFATATKMDLIEEALVKSGRIDKKIEFNYVSQEQVDRLFSRFFPSTSTILHSSDKKSHQLSDLAHEFSSSIPENEFTISQIRHYLMKHQSSPESAVANIRDWVKDTQEQKRKHAEEELEAERLRLEAAVEAEKNAAMMQPIYSGVCGTPLSPPIPNEGVHRGCACWSPISSPPTKLEEEMSEVAEKTIQDAE